MARDLGNARKNKNDEFYTQFSDIQKEMNAIINKLRKGSEVL